mmetsp:Transcript_31000/g.54399  ORF Transcript_31000/g.54399 Transcript_31000/m.54399 type:complete len:250 (+) Transcript_31000:73-822(+)
MLQFCLALALTSEARIASPVSSSANALQANGTLRFRESADSAQNAGSLDTSKMNLAYLLHAFETNNTAPIADAIRNAKAGNLKNLLSALHNAKSPSPPHVQCPADVMEKWKRQTNGWTQINGAKVPGEMRGLANSVEMLDTINTDTGYHIKINKGIRQAGTRVGIHTHQYGGYTTVLDGIITDFIEGMDNTKYNSGSGYFMPSCLPMAAANLEKTDATIIDTFITPPGEPDISIWEPGWQYVGGAAVAW